MTPHEQFADLSLWLWTELANHLWQSTLFFLLVTATVLTLRKADAKSRYLVWLIASAKFVLPLSAFAFFGRSLNLSALFPPAAIIESPGPGGINLLNIVSIAPAATTVISATQTTSGHNEVYCLLTLFWLIGSLSLFALWRKQSQASKLSLEYEYISPSTREAELFNNAQAGIGLNAACINFTVSGTTSAPFVKGVWSPIVVMPQGLSQKLTDEEFKAVLMHELAHVARRDNLVGVLQMALCCLLWFNPLIWFIRRKLLEERERACDEEVIRLENKPQVYTSGLLKVVQYGLHLHQTAGIANAAGANLNKRLELIMKNKNGRMKNRWQKWVVGGAFGTLLLVCVFSGLETTHAGSSYALSKVKNLQAGSEANSSTQNQDLKKVSYQVLKNEDCPLKITEAAGEEITDRQYTNFTGRATVTTKANGKSIFPNLYSAPEVKMINTSGKTIVGLILVVYDPRPTGAAQARVIVQGRLAPAAGAISISHGEGQARLIQQDKAAGQISISISPEQSYMVDFRLNYQKNSDKYWLEFTDPTNFYVTVWEVHFDDGTSWLAKDEKL